MSDIETAFQDGCDTIVAGCTTYGSTPTSNSPSDIVYSIGVIYTNRYNAGYSAGNSAGYNSGYSNGYNEGYNAFYTNNVQTINQTKTLSCSGSGGWGVDHTMNWVFTTPFIEVPEISYTLGGDTSRASNVRISKTETSCSFTINMYSQGSSYVLYVYAQALGKVVKS